MDEIVAILNQKFGIEKFYELQEDVINSILAKKDSIIVMPTGGGKSLCYQIPALVFENLTIVVSPLISLMEDQVSNLKGKFNIKECEYIASNRNNDEINHIFSNLEKLKILYVTPERLTSENFIRTINNKNIKISMLVIDEAHSISLWGNSFRKSYLRIRKFIKEYNPEVISAFTATANEKIINDIIFYLGMKNPMIFKKSVYRENLSIKVILSSEKLDFLETLLSDDESIIIYTSSKITLERIKKFLIYKNYKVSVFHADLSDEEKKENQKEFLDNNKKIMVATSAFGMGIDKKDVRKIIHIEIPYDIEEYFQEIGRAGRDGKHSDCYLILSLSDFEEYEKFLQRKFFFSDLLKKKLKQYFSKVFKFPLKEILKEALTLLTLYYFQRRKRVIELKKYEIIRDFILSNDCKFRILLTYFGEKNMKKCNHCSSCKIEKKKLSEPDIKILACIPKYFWISIEEALKILQGKSLSFLLFKGYGKTRGLSPEKIINSIQNLYNSGLINIKREKQNFYIKAKT